MKLSWALNIWLQNSRYRSQLDGIALFHEAQLLVNDRSNLERTSYAPLSIRPLAYDEAESSMFLGMSSCACWVGQVE